MPSVTREPGHWSHGLAIMSASILVASAAHGQGGSGAGDPYSHPSSVDGEVLEGLVYVPSTYNPSDPPTALVVYLHGGGGLGIVPQGWKPLLDARKWILVAPHGRQWGLSSPELCPTNPNAVGPCNWCTSAAYVDNSFDALVGPGEQDILDSIAWAMTQYNINPRRVYLTGFSMGGRGTYQIGLRNPHLFAAIAPCAPASDMFEIYVADPNPPDICKRFMLHDGAGGLVPGASGITDSMYYQTSARFLIENAMNLPVHHSHGTQDALAYNIISAPTRFLHGAQMLYDTSFDECHGASDLCFGHTPTLSELSARFPGAYEWSYLFTPVAHTLSPGWAPAIFQHFDTAIRPDHPRDVFYKTYTASARRAYWLQVDSAVPWTGVPAAVHATAEPTTNAAHLRVCRTARATISLAGAELALSPSSPITVTVGRLDATGLDPALASPGEAISTTVRLDGAAACGPLVATIDGVAAPSGFVRWVAGPSGRTPSIIVGPVEIAVGAADRVITIAQSGCASPCVSDINGDGMVDGIDLASLLGSWGVVTDPNGSGDLNGDGVVDGLDLGMLLGAWGPCRS